MAKKRRSPEPPVGMRALLDGAGVERRVVRRRRSETLFEQGEPADDVHYIESGGVRISVRSTTGREAILTILGAGQFVGEGALAGQSVRMATATALTATTTLVVPAAEMMRVLHLDPSLAGRFITHMLNRNLQVEEDLVDQLFNSAEKRLARTLLRLAHYGAPGAPDRLLPKMSQATLADMIGTTRSRVNVFMAKFRRLGFIDDGPAGTTINRSLLTVILHD